MNSGKDTRNKPTALIVSADDSAGKHFEDMLISDGLEAQSVTSARTACKEHVKFEVILILAPLADLEPLDLCRRIRTENARVLVLLVLEQMEEMEKVLALELGVDECFSRSVHPIEFRARLKSLLRRAAIDDRDLISSTHLTLGSLSIDIDRRKVKQNGALLHLTPTEFSLLESMTRRAGKAVSTSELAYELWGMDSEVYEDNIKYHISRLRSKIEQNSQNPEYIKTIRGMGYRIVSAEEIGAK